MQERIGKEESERKKYVFFEKKIWFIGERERKKKAGEKERNTGIL